MAKKIKTSAAAFNDLTAATDALAKLPAEASSEERAAAVKAVTDAQAAFTAAQTADAAPDPDAPKIDETVEGGRYIVAGVPVDANGKPLED